MSEDKHKEAMNKALFSNLVIMFSTSAMQQLGKLVDPMTSKTQVNIDGAQVTIDMISMLKDKTEGNLDKDEEKLMKDVLSSLQMNFVEVAKEQKAKDGEKEKEGGEPVADASEKLEEEKSDVDDPSASSPRQSSGQAGQGKDPKFHKSYDEEK